MPHRSAKRNSHPRKISNTTRERRHKRDAGTPPQARRVRHAKRERAVSRANREQRKHNREKLSAKSSAREAQSAQSARKASVQLGNRGKPRTGTGSPEKQAFTEKPRDQREPPPQRARPRAVRKLAQELLLLSCFSLSQGRNTIRFFPQAKQCATIGRNIKGIRMLD